MALLGHLGRKSDEAALVHSGEAGSTCRMRRYVARLYRDWTTQQQFLALLGQESCTTT